MAFISSDISSKSTKRDLISIWNGIEKLESSERTLLTIDDVAKEIRGDWKGRKCFVVDKSSYNGKPLTYDGLKWRKKIAPKYRQWNENGRVYGTIQCRSPSTASFRKTVVYMDDSTFVIVDYHRDEERISLDFDIHRMTASEVDIVRSELIGRSVKSAYEILHKKGFKFSLEQVRNQRKHVPESIGCNRGVKAIATTSELGKIARNVPNAKYSVFECNGGMVDCLSVILDEPFRIVLNCLPTTNEYESHLRLFEDINENNKKEHIQSLLEQWKVSNDDGFLFSGVTQLDTTFGLSELYVTLMCTTVKIFKSKNQKKPRTIVISYLLHSKKTMECHKFHANHVNEYLQKQGFKNDRVVPGFITDGEKSFEEYYKV
ncbi:unnamed protein product [Caenorhabditis bovis]|uniref:Uncharacterized protein n=1 Tax=Caenorhabditis bovis TaxID=2654633 RepID=A0A8S1FC60_9PELO|nr:unnamed protein product [Caenorhabditis bovis]